jgi:hypothetical protein
MDTPQPNAKGEMTNPEPVSLTVHSVNTPDLAEPVQAQARRTTSGRLKMLLVLLVCASPVIASYFTYFVIRPEGRTNYSSLIEPSRSWPPAMPLTRLDGTTQAATALRGQWLLVVVGPAACDAACEKRLFVQRQLREMLGREKDRLDKLWLITDNAPLAPALQAALQGSGVTLLRADGAAVATWLVPDAGQQLQDHLYVVDPMGQWMMRLPAQVEPPRAKKDLDRLLRGSSFWDKPGRNPNP